jgi:hypothetical protein
MRQANATAQQQNYANQLGQLTTGSTLQTQALQRGGIEQQQALAGMELAEAKARQEAGLPIDASAEYTQWLEAGSPGTFEDWVKWKSRISASSDRTALERNWQLLNSVEPERRQELLSLLRGQGPHTIGGVEYGIGPDGQPYLLNDPERPGQTMTASVQARQEATAAAQKEYDTKMHSGQAQTDADFENFKQTRFQPIVSQLDDARELLRQLRDPDSGVRRTGILEGRFRGYTNREVAELQFSTIKNLLQNLQITSLTPVTEKELDLVSGLYAKLTNDPEANIGIMEGLEKVLRGKIQQFYDMDRYFKENRTLRGYEPPGYNPPEATRASQATDSTSRALNDAMSRYGGQAVPVTGD